MLNILKQKIVLLIDSYTNTQAYSCANLTLDCISGGSEASEWDRDCKPVLKRSGL